MALFTNSQPRRYANTINIGKTKDTGTIFTVLKKTNSCANVTYFNDSNRFLSTTTTGFSISTYDLSNQIVSNYEYNTAYSNLVVKPYLESYIRPISMAPVANAQIDTSLTCNLVTNDTLKLTFVANYAAASVTLKLASDTAYASTISWTVTGTSTNTGTAGNPKYETNVMLKVATGTLSGSPVLSSVIRSRIISVNSTSSNTVAPVQLLIGNNYSAFSGEIINNSLCCAENLLDKITTATDSIKCGTSIIGDTIKEQKIEFSFDVMEENPKFLALFASTIVVIDSIESWKHLSGYEVGQVSNKILPDVVGTPTRGQIQLDLNLEIRDVVIGCSSLAQANFDLIPGIATNVSSYIGDGCYSYDKATGLMYFSIANISKIPEIKIGDAPVVELVIPKVGTLPELQQITLIDKDTAGKRRFVKIARCQFQYPDRAITSTGNKLSFKGTAYFAKTGDIVYGYEI